MGTCRALQIGLSLFLLASSLYLYMFVSDWWIYGTVCIVAGILNGFCHTGCPFWRFLASALILLGTIETLFLVWSIRLVEQSAFFAMSPTVSPREELFEGRLILLPALATSLTISTRLGSAKHEGLLDILRSLLLLAFLLALVPALAYSLTFFVPALSSVVTHAIEQIPQLNAFF